ncbi:MAG: hypothetical protein DWQ47_11025 [Acidobacteria bacterium]|nr:MAG: hypothetical protein DWQ32_13440 [Acidobacteriota bacterium]REJ98111.1 MAG: hypothetical protein DWQ38_16240 [Acidobacteriota bacterium]REK16854.1 MAG: hypothetical protein DWQ43_01285 [Acidobacteriota bacterium]REK42765.1 MAG: hypothetical protein DWQ47_11025 [Acidobacteriota bacterium]
MSGRFATSKRCAISDLKFQISERKIEISKKKFQIPNSRWRFIIWRKRDRKGACLRRKPNRPAALRDLRFQSSDHREEIPDSKFQMALDHLAETRP